MKTIRIFFLASLLAFFSTSSIHAAPAEKEIDIDSLQCAVCEEAESMSFGESAPGKIGRGLVNLGLGWTNLFAQPIQAGKSGGSILKGIGKGFSLTVVRMVQGVVELGLFWLPSGPGGESLKHCALGDMGVTGR
ncbi:MAG: hypothetical protein HY583_03630 [Candidatus Omnitrophica bacterium]|nr:hypothetical protein [Candidatus Omnitrophota bacterium]